MSRVSFESLAPWTGAVAGLAWVGQALLIKWSDSDVPGSASSSATNAHLAGNIGGLACLVVMGMALVVFAATVRNHLRSGEGREAAYSSVAYGGFLLMASGPAQMAVWSNGLLSAAEVHDDAAMRTLDYIGYFGWAGMTMGLAVGLIAFGLGGVRAAVLPPWFAWTSVVMGVLCALGAAHIPPGGLVSYLLLPFWLVASSVVIARRQNAVVQARVLGGDGGSASLRASNSVARGADSDIASRDTEGRWSKK